MAETSSVRPASNTVPGWLAVDPRRAARHAGVVFYVVALATAYVLVLQNLARLDLEGVTSGAGVERPRRSGGPGVYPPSR